MRDGNLAVIVTDPYAVLTLESIKKAIPGYDPYVVFVGYHPIAVDKYLEGRHDIRRTANIPAFDVKSVFQALQHMTKGIMLCVDGGCLVLKDPSRHLPKLAGNHSVSSAISREYMYGRRMLHNKHYKAIGVSLDDDRNPHVSCHNLDKPFNGEEFGFLDTPLRFSADPLISNFFHGREWVRHSTEATQAAVIDYLPQALDPNISVKEVYAYPLDIYAFFANRVKDYLPPDAVAAMVRNGRRSKIIAPLRKIIKPATLR
ncbi:MAG TPA: hypothetical protein VN081_02565 [Dongiaceae bacterium]|nr:hypothetical protein [Dongiaceae bacterium]